MAQDVNKKISTPVIYSGSTERTSFAEKDEDKGFMVLETSPGHLCWKFCKLPSSPMVVLNLNLTGMTGLATDWTQKHATRKKMKPLTS